MTGKVHSLIAGYALLSVSLGFLLFAVGNTAWPYLLLGGIAVLVALAPQ